MDVLSYNLYLRNCMKLKTILLCMGIGLGIVLLGTFLGALVSALVGKTAGQVLAFIIGFSGVVSFNNLLTWMEK